MPIKGAFMKENYIYPARFEIVEDVIEVSFIDFPHVRTYGDNPDEAIVAAQELLALQIIDCERRNKLLPEATKEAVGAVYVHVWLPYFQSKTKEVYVRKSVTISQWLDQLAKGKDINFSGVLARGIKKELGITDESEIKKELRMES